MWIISVFGCLFLFAITHESGLLIASALYSIAAQLEWNRKGR